MKNNIVEKCLKSIAEKHGGILIPEHVVQAAKPKNHPLHDRFDWDDTSAAHEYRLVQARSLIRVTVEILGNGLAPSPVFVSLSPDRKKGGGYRVMTTVLTQAELREQMLQDALFELNQLTRKYSQLKQLSEVFQVIRKTVKKAA